MANWCSTTIAIYSNKEEEVRKFHQVLEELANNPSRLQSGFGNLWLGNLLDYHGISWESVNCRGWIHDFDEPSCNDFGEWYMYVHADDAWCPMLDVWRAIFDLPQYNQLGYEYCAEEPGCEIYETSDKYGSYFSERYHVDMCYTDTLGSEHYVNEYYETEEYLLNHLNQLIKDPTIDFPICAPKCLNSFEEAKAFFDNACEYDDDWYASIHKIEVIE